MHFTTKIIAYFIKLPASMKGMKFGRNSFIAPGYDFLFSNLSNITVNNNVVIGKRAWLQTVDKGQIIIGNNTHIGRDVLISSRKKVEIGESCLISMRVTIVDHDHKFDTTPDSPMNSGLTEGEYVVIGNNCFLGVNVCITKGVKLGEHCIVGANSVVTKSFPKNSVIGGSPARLIRRLI